MVRHFKNPAANLQDFKMCMTILGHYALKGYNIHGWLNINVRAR